MFVALGVLAGCASDSDGHGDSNGDSAANSGTGGTANSGGTSSLGDVPFDAPCVEDADCVVASYLDECYEPSCETAQGVHVGALADPCWVEWSSVRPPEQRQPTGCAHDPLVSCSSGCESASSETRAPIIVSAWCEAGRCRAEFDRFAADDMSCEALNARRDDALVAARRCTVSSTCAADGTLLDGCGCTVAWNTDNQEALVAAQDAYAAWQAASCPRPANCSVACPPVSSTLSCLPLSSETGSVCR